MVPRGGSGNFDEKKKGGWGKTIGRALKVQEFFIDFLLIWPEMGEAPPPPTPLNLRLVSLVQCGEGSILAGL